MSKYEPITPGPVSARAKASMITALETTVADDLGFVSCPSCTVDTFITPAMLEAAAAAEDEHRRKHSAESGADYDWLNPSPEERFAAIFHAMLKAVNLG